MFHQWICGFALKNGRITNTDVQETAEEKAERDRRQGGPGLKAGWSTGGNDIYPGSATVTQTADIKTAKGKTYKAFSDPVTSTEESCPLVDSFTMPALSGLTSKRP